MSLNFYVEAATGHCIVSLNNNGTIQPLGIVYKGNDNQFYYVDNHKQINGLPADPGIYNYLNQQVKILIDYPPRAAAPAPAPAQVPHYMQQPQPLPLPATPAPFNTDLHSELPVLYNPQQPQAHLPPQPQLHPPQQLLHAPQSNYIDKQRIEPLAQEARALHEKLIALTQSEFNI